MALLLAFAFVSGIITILSPCILPVLPIVLSGGVGRGRGRPFGVLVGFVASFTIFTLTLTAIVQSLGIAPDALRWVAVVMIVLLGLVMVIPRLRELFERLASRLASVGGRVSARGGRPAAAPGGGPAPAAGAPAAQGFWSGTLVGVSLGLVWTPCVGPIMASVISLALTQQLDGGAVFITLAYTLGTAIPMLGVMLGGRALLARVPALTRNTGTIQRVFGILMIAVGFSIAVGWDRQLQSVLLRAFPNYGTGLTAVENTAPARSALEARVAEGEPGGDSSGAGSGPGGAGGAEGEFSARAVGVSGREDVLGDYGTAPALIAGGKWFNTQAAAGGGDGSLPLSMERLRGRVVLVDFWTYSCINCVRTIPYLQEWHDRYADQGLVIIGVHTPEFEFEKKPQNLARAIRDLGVRWPVVQDNGYAQWNAYGNRFWPAHYFIDAEGKVRFFHFGEGAYEESEQVIQTLLREAVSTVARPGGTAPGKAEEGPASMQAAGGSDAGAGTPETYLGYGRGRGFASAVAPVPDQVAAYRPARTPENGEWNLDGRWTIARQYVRPEGAGTLELGFHARRVYLVVEPVSAGASIRVQVDGVRVPDTRDVEGGAVYPEESRLYELVDLPEAGPHVLSLEVMGDLRLFAFTFG